jgi:hypothetical protein
MESLAEQARAIIQEKTAAPVQQRWRLVQCRLAIDRKNHLPLFRAIFMLSLPFQLYDYGVDSPQPGSYKIKVATSRDNFCVFAS